MDIRLITRVRIKAAIGRISVLLIVGLLASVVPAAAQVSIDYNGSELVIRNEGFASQRAVRSYGKDETEWSIEDGVGNVYEKPRGDENADRFATQWTAGGAYNSSEDIAAELIAGYDEALQHLVDRYAAIVTEDSVMDLNYVSFPEAEDPYGTMVSALLNDSLWGRPLVAYFKSLELTALGTTGDGLAEIDSVSSPTTFPNDQFFNHQWNLSATRLRDAHRIPLISNLSRPVRIAVLDSGIDGVDAVHSGLDGVADIRHIWTAPATDLSDKHALAVTTLLADRGNDRNGIAGLVGSYEEPHDDSASTFTRHPVEILSYSVGARGPFSDFVARAIHDATEAEVDIILLNFRMAYSPLVESKVENAIAAGIVVVAGAGNYDPLKKTKPTGFPAYLDGVVSVASSGKDGLLSSFSASQGYTIAAPGEDVIVGLTGDRWGMGNGTSFASPHVAAVAALAKMIEPDISSHQFIDLLQENVGQEGILDAVRVIEAALKRVDISGGNEGWTCPATLRITGFRTDESNNGEGGEYVKIANTGLSPVAIDGCSIAFFDGVGSRSYFSMDLEGTIPVGGVHIVGNSGVLDANQIFPDSTIKGGPAAITVLSLAGEDVPNGTAASEVALIPGAVRASIIYLDGDTIFGQYPTAAGKSAIEGSRYDLAGVLSQAHSTYGSPLQFTLEQNFPNPFNPSTTIRFSLPNPSHVRLTIYDTIGREVSRILDRSLDAGWHDVRWDAQDLASGVYLYRIDTEGQTQVRNMLLLK